MLITQRLEAMRYDGTNGAEVVAWLNGSADLLTDDGETLTLAYCGSEYPVPAGGYAIAGGTNHNFHAGIGPDDFAAAWVELPS